MRRALPAHCPIMRNTPGSSFGPMAISATTPMTSSSLHPLSNMNHSASRERLFAGSRCLCPVRSVGVAADVMARRGLLRRRGVVDGLHRLGLRDRLVIIVGHALLERLDALRNVAHQVGNLAATEQ